MPKKVSISGAETNFSYEWKQTNAFVTESDLWVYYYGEEKQRRVSIPDQKTKVESSELDNINKVFHTSFDPYGRVLSAGYWASFNEQFLTNDQ